MIKIFSPYNEIKFENNSNIISTNDIDDANFLYLEYQICSRKQNVDEILKDKNHPINKMREYAKLHKKKLIYVCYGDLPPNNFLIDDFAINFKNSLFSKLKAKNDYCFPRGINDKFNNSYIENPELSIGFVGHTGYGRKKILDMLTNTTIKTNFILRNEYFCARGNKRKYMENEFETNIKNNIFTFCYRGRGNFSLRFYEVLMYGRIPILINTDSVLPYNNIIDYDKVGLIIDETDISDEKYLENKIITYYENNKKDLLNIQKNNRLLYEKYFDSKNFMYEFFVYCNNFLNEL